VTTGLVPIVQFSAPLHASLRALSSQSDPYYAAEEQGDCGPDMNIITRIDRYEDEAVLEKVDLKRLRYFQAVAEAGSFSRAAERLHIAQSHLSRQVMRLEQALGHLLLVRRPRHVELTDAGQILLEESRSITLKLDGLPRRMSEATGGATGSLCIGLTIGASFHPTAARAIESFARQKPQVALNFSVASRKALIEAIIDRRVQATFAPAPVVGITEIRVDMLVTEPILLAVHKGHRLAGRAKIELFELSEEPFVLWERSGAPEMYDDLVAACQNAGFSPRVIQQVPQEVCALLIASAGVAATFVPASFRDLHADNLHFVSLQDPVLSASLALITRANEHLASVKLLRKRALALATAVPAHQ
jgi:DNA-binding transcriptional LysR family regulator